MSDTNEKSATCGNPKHHPVLCDGSGYDCTPAPAPPWTVADAKALRDATGAGLNDCREALTWAEGKTGLAAWYIKRKGQAVARTCERCRLRYSFPEVKRGPNDEVLHDC